MIALLRRMIGGAPVVDENQAWLERARAVDWDAAVLAARIGNMTGDEAAAIMREPQAFDTLSVAAALEFKPWG